LKKHRDYEDEMNEATKAKEVTAYEDSWYRSLKALADMRPIEAEVPGPEEERAPAEEIQPIAEEERAAADDQYAVAEEQHAAAEDVHPPAEDVWHRPEDARPIHSDEETAGVPED
jgi:hypothetical protein